MLRIPVALRYPLRKVNFTVTGSAVYLTPLNVLSNFFPASYTVNTSTSMMSSCMLQTPFLHDTMLRIAGATYNVIFMAGKFYNHQLRSIFDAAECLTLSVQLPIF
jgi:hypothetical protein